MALLSVSLMPVCFSASSSSHNFDPKPLDAIDDQQDTICFILASIDFLNHLRNQAVG
jgi:hypothetical protein